MCGIISCYKTVQSAVCPDDCHNQSISLRVKFWQIWPQFTEQVIRTVDHHYNRPPTSVSLLWMLALRLFVNAPHQNTTRLLRLNTVGQLSLPTGSPLARPATRITLSAVYVYVVSDWLRQIGRSSEQVSQTQTMFASPRMVRFSKTTLNSTSVILPSLQNVRHSHIQSLYVDGKYNRWVCAF